jgi:hypothetical protein
MMTVISGALAFGVLVIVFLGLCLALVIGCQIIRVAGIGFWGVVRMGMLVIAMFGLGQIIVERLQPAPASVSRAAGASYAVERAVAPAR